MTRTRYKILPNDQSPYFITATTVNWLPLFSNPTIANFVIDSLKFLQSANRIVIYAYNLMENHLHLVASADDLSKEIANFKSYTARQC
jgi:putative transposase